MNVVLDKMVVFASSPLRQILQERPCVDVVSLYHPFVPDNEESSKVFDDDEDIDCFLSENIDDESPLPGIIDVNNNVYPKGLIPLEDMFRHDDVPKNPSPDPEPAR